MPIHQTELAARFRALHGAHRPLILVNAWDAGSARAVAAAGAPAVGTSSAAVALAHGSTDGERLPLDLVCANAARIAAAVDIPVTIDLERGYGASPADVAQAVARIIDAGAVGCNLEDSVDDAGTLRDVADQAGRLRAARAAADAALPGFFINVRTDLFLFSDPSTHAGLLDAAIARSHAYRDAGADGLFVPGLADAQLIARMVRAAPLPVNVMVLDLYAGTAAAHAAAAGVARISQGPGPYLAMMEALQQAARSAQQAAAPL